MLLAIYLNEKIRKVHEHPIYSQFQYTMKLIIRIRWSMQNSPQFCRKCCSRRILDLPLILINLRRHRRRCCCRLLRLGLFLLLVQFFNGLDFFLEFHAPILEPNFYLSLRQTECVCHLNPPPPRQIVVGVEFLFEFQSLVTGVGLAPSSS